MGQFQNSTFNGGTFDDETEQFYLVGLNLEYRFNRHFSAHVGYNYDRLESDIDVTAILIETEFTWASQPRY